MTTSTNRPKYLNLIQIRLPIPGVVSFAHRISGVLMFLAIPVSVYLLHLSTASEAGFNEVTTMFGHPLAKLILLVLAWSVFHHFFAGIRYLLIDADIGVEKQGARFGAWLVLGAGLMAALVVLVILI